MNSVKTSILSVFILMFLFLTIQAQKNIDSLHLSLQFTENPKEKIEILLTLSDESKNNDPAKALNFAQKAYKLSEETGKIGPIAKVNWFGLF